MEAATGLLRRFLLAMTSFSVLAMHLHPSWRHASNEKLRTLPALRTDLRQQTPAVVTGAVTIRASSHA
jgi:predicted ATP-binding protein involved in virulence